MTLKTTLMTGAALTVMAGAATAEGTIAYFAGTSQNGFNQATYEGVQAVAAERGYETEILDGQFDAALQYSQIEDALASGRFVGMIVSPNDSVGIAGAFEQAIADGVPIGTVLFPVGPDLNSLEPQVDGITVTAASPPWRAPQPRPKKS
ncbi:substrate-binding domain-containing protein [Fontisubflavum oceani]|uniref:substrate-binding domain-containing protein n=1 Tax=Fontisubflavum oceani TaxID=2978973 RepID=UPI0025B3EE21|nr:substrate-binding domain-containing protein [Fontisubflavum oceani]WJY23224.1 substrate-binding domain-containing protein [Fontisubflavum oceani]